MAAANQQVDWESELEVTDTDIQLMIQKRRENIEKVNIEMAEGGVFSTLKESVERLAQHIHTTQEKQKNSEKQAQDFIKQLEEEISKLEQLSRPKSHLKLLHRVQPLEVRVRPPSYEGAVGRAAAQLVKTLREETKKLLQAELRRVQQYAVDVTLDPDTAHPNLVLSEDGKQVHDSDVKNFPDNPERFSSYVSVLGNPSFTSGRFYYEVQVKGKTRWDLGVARESVDRQGLITPKTEEGFWCLRLRDGNVYEAHDNPVVPLSLRPQPEKVGVFVDHDGGLVSFFDVDSADLIYTFTGCSFKDKLRPYFMPEKNDGGRNSAPLIILEMKKNLN
ncbi:E3 ubiquitin-protein ligase TRIM39-like [Halichoeres trimaculatus]|uniref:E3 ubiquitin-protein ligase TRIM39-like n=1 Tax=Halichoeres trimaculatus TaxID=147232 RepID=UPI003D9F7C99